MIESLVEGDEEALLPFQFRCYLNDVGVHCEMG